MKVKYVFESLEEFHKNSVNEGWKENLITGLMLLFGVGVGSAQQLYTPEKKTKELASLKLAEDYMKKGWTKDSVVIDTIWRHSVVPMSEQGDVNIVSKVIDAENCFKSGGYELSSEFKQELKDSLESCQGMPFANIQIVTSTDKQPVMKDGKLGKLLKSSDYSVDNEGLAKLRADKVKQYLMDSLEVKSEDSIIVELKANQGLGTRDEYKSTGFKYAKVIFNFASFEEIPPNYPPSKLELEVNTTYYMSKQEKPHGVKYSWNRKTGGDTKINKIENTSRDWENHKTIKCPNFNQTESKYKRQMKSGKL